MRDIHAIRHQNLVYIAEQAKQSSTTKALVMALGIAKVKLDEHLDNPFMNITDRIARRCEKFINKPKGWMDEQHVESDPLCAAFPDDMREEMEIYSNLEPEERQRFLIIARVFTATPTD